MRLAYSHQNNKNYLSPIQSWSANFEKKQSDQVPIWPKLAPVLIQYHPVQIRAHLCWKQRWADIDFLTSDPYLINFLNIHIKSLSEKFWNLVSDIHLYPNATLVKYDTNSHWS